MEEDQDPSYFPDLGPSACRIHLESGAEAAVCMLWRGMHCLRSISDLEFCVCPYLLVYFVVRGYVNT